MHSDSSHVEELLTEALTATSETSTVDFKLAFDPKDPRDRVEIVKDIVAMANSGGGILLFGLDDNGQPDPANSAALPRLDPADITNWIEKYTLMQFGMLELRDCEKHENHVLALIVGAVETPLIFAKPGTYNIGKGKQKTAFAQGTVYFRHGAKSAPGTTEDLRIAIEQAKQSAVEFLKAGMRQVIEAPSNARIVVEGPGTHKVRVVEDSEAEPVRTLRPDETHPYRHEMLVEEVKKRIPPTVRFNGHDVVCIRWSYNVTENAEYYYKSDLHGSPQYSDAFIDFIVEHIMSDPTFLRDARTNYRERNNRS